LASNPCCESGEITSFLKEEIMAKFPVQYMSIRKRFKKYFKAVDSLGNAAKTSGPIKSKTSQLIQLAAAAAIRSEGAVHSHAKGRFRQGQNQKRYTRRFFCLQAR